MDPVIMQNGVFCPLPWVHLATRPNGQLRLCCKAKDSPFNISDIEVSDYWNSDYMQDIRTKMVNGIYIDECENCYQSEELGSASKRWQSYKLFFKNIKKAEAIEHNLPTELDLRPGNLCNLKCKMCNPINSSLFANEFNNINKNQQNPILNQWSDVCINKFYNLFKTTNTLYLLGGESGIDVSVLHVLNEVKSNNLKFKTNTNCFRPDPSFVNLVEETHSEIICSIDGYGEINNYIRYPSNWQEVEKNFDIYLKIANSISINVTVSIYNILYLKDLIQWARSKKENIVITLEALTFPDYMSLNLLPYDENIEKELLSFKHTNNKFNTRIDMIIKELKKPATDEQYKMFWLKTNEQDRHRGTYLKNELPELYEKLIEVK